MTTQGTSMSTGLLASVTRRLILEAVKHNPPANAVERSDGLHDLTLDLADVFHHGYIEVHDRLPSEGTNPFLDEYAPLLDSETDLLKWSDGIARGDHKNSESQKLGRIFARAYLSLHGYRWFPDIKDLLRSPERGWSVKRPQAGGNMPDWLVGDTNKVAVAEAKGTHSSIHQSSTVLDKSWRPQVKNVEVYKDDDLVTLKGWIVATRWVAARQTRTDPKLYAEDPDVPGHREIGEDEASSLNLWLARVHTLRNLRRLGRYRIAQRVAAIGGIRQTIPPARATTWRCIAPGLGWTTFVGRPTGRLPAWMPWFPMDWRFVREMLPIPIDRAEWERWTRLWTAVVDDALDDMWFDGVALPVVKALVRDELPPTLEESEVQPPGHLGESLLPDGSLLAPMSLMQPSERVEI